MDDQSSKDGAGLAQPPLPRPASGFETADLLRPPTLHQLDVLHQALFGWPTDHLTPVPELLRAFNITDAARKILASRRFRWDIRGRVPIWPEDKWVCADAFGLRVWVNLRDGYVSWGVLHEDWENQEIAFVLRHLRPGDAFVDVGANIGVYALQAARAVGPDGHVYCIEPRPDTYGMLVRSIEDNGFAGRCTAFNVALGAQERQGDLNAGHDVLNPGSTFISERDGGPVRVCPLDSLPIGDDRPVRVLKMDIEGFEPAMMDGATAFFAKHRPVVLTEMFPRAIREAAGRTAVEFHDQFTELRYGVHRLDGSTVGARMSRADVAAIDEDAEPFNIVGLPE